ncbi:MAG: archaemetzincin family Zn-dependent metalloprotease [Candidatus Bathyarchaeia archaeon]
MRLTTLVVGVGEADSLDLELVSKTFTRDFHGQIAPVLKLNSTPIPSNAYDPARMQYLAPSLLMSVEALRRMGGYHLGFGVTLLDLYVDDLNFIFGEASGRTAILSTNRLRMGLEPSSEPYAKRVAVVAKHEMGHMLGLNHCLDPMCCMRFHNSVLEVDGSSGGFCPKCRGKIAEILGGSEKNRLGGGG